MIQSEYSLGEKVLITKKDLQGQKGTILFIGPLEGKEDQYCGIALENHNGNHNGSFNNKQYFECEDKCGIFITEKYIQKIIVAKKEEVKKEEAKKEEAKKEPIKPKPTITKKPEEQPKQQKPTTNQSVIKLPKKPAEPEKIEKKEIKKVVEPSSEQQPIEIPIDIIPTTLIESKLDENQKDEIEQLQSSLTSAREDLQNIKQSQAALQAVNTDLRVQVQQLRKKNEDSLVQPDNSEEIEELEYLVEKITMERDNMQHRHDTLKKSFDEQSNTLALLQYEKEMAELNLEEAIMTGGQNLQPDDGNQNIELVNMNNQLRQALNIVKLKLSESETMHELEQLELQQQVEQLIVQAEKAKQVDKLNSLLIQRNKEIDELNQRVDDLQSFSDLTEKLTDSLIRKDDEITALKQSKREMLELKKLDEEYLSDLEQMTQTQQDQLKKIEFELLEYKRLHQVLLKESEGKDQIQIRLKTKIGQQNKELELLRDDEQIDKTEVKDINLNKAQELLLKCQDIQSQRREMQRKFFDLQIDNSSIRNDVLLKSVLLLHSLPQDYQSKLKFNLIDQILVVRKVGEISNFLAEEFLQTLDNNSDTYVKEENSDFGFWIIDILKNLYSLITLSQTVSSAFENATKLELVERSARNSVLINQFKMAGSLVEQIAQLLKEDSLSSRESISGLQVVISHIREDTLQLFEQQENIENKGIQVRFKLQTLVAGLAYWVFNGKVIRDLELQKKSSKGPFTLDQLIDTLIKRAKQHIKVLNIYRQSWGTFENFIGKNGLNYDALENILNEINQFINKHLSPETHELYLTGKGDEAMVLNQIQLYNNKQLNEQLYQKFREYCISMVHILNILNQSLGDKFNTIEDIMDEFSISHRNTRSNLHIYGKNTIWAKLAQTIKKQLDDMSLTIESERRLKEELEISFSDKMLMQNQITTLKKAREALEGRVVELQLKADRVQVVENEKKSLQNKIERYQSATELAKQEFQNLENRFKEVEEERNNLEQLIVIFQQALQTNKKSISEAAEPIISRLSPRLQIKIQKIIDQVKQEVPADITVQQPDTKTKMATLGQAINQTIWREYQKMRQQQLRNLIIGLQQQTIQRPSLPKPRTLELRSMALAKIVNLAKPNNNETIVQLNMSSQIKNKIRTNHMCTNVEVLMQSLNQIIV